MENNLTLNNGVKIPNIGFGTYPLFGNVLINAIMAAYSSGYRLFDTSDNYYNESDLGDAIEKLYQKTTAIRNDIFLVTKISDELYKPGTLGGGTNKGVYFWKNSATMQQLGKDAVHKVVESKVNNSLAALKTDYIDLLLMHWPYPDYFQEIWYEMEQIYKSGKVRAIGVCNYAQRHLEKLKQSATVKPMVNQFETSPINAKESIINYCNENGIKIMVYSPLMNLNLKSEPAYKQYLRFLSDKYEKSIQQIVLKFDIMRGLIPIPKSSHADRIRANIDIFDFVLTKDEVKNLLSFNADIKYMPESRSCPGL